MTPNNEALAAERKRFEHWYVTHAFDYSRDPIGSRDCSLQWVAWQAALASSGQAASAVPLKDEDHAWADAMVRHLKAQGEDVNLEKSALETLFVIARFIALDTVAEAEKPGYDPHKPVSFAFMEAIERYGRASPTREGQDG